MVFSLFLLYRGVLCLSMKNVLWLHNLFFCICSVIPAKSALVLPHDVLIFVPMENQKPITHTNLKNANKLLPQNQFLRVNRSYIVNRDRIDSFSNNDVFIGPHEISIGNFYRDDFFEQMMGGSPPAKASENP